MNPDKKPIIPQIKDGIESWYRKEYKSLLELYIKAGIPVAIILLAVTGGAVVLPKIVSGQDNVQPLTITVDLAGNHHGMKSLFQFESNQALHNLDRHLPVETQEDPQKTLKENLKISPLGTPYLKNGNRLQTILNDSKEAEWQIRDQSQLDPSGTKLVNSRYRIDETGQNYQIGLEDLETGQTVSVNLESYPISPQWRGGNLFYGIETSSGLELWQMGFETGKILVFENELDPYDINISPTGQTVALIGLDNQQNKHLILRDLETDNVNTLVTDKDLNLIETAWSADGNTLGMIITKQNQPHPKVYFWEIDDVNQLQTASPIGTDIEIDFYPFDLDIYNYRDGEFIINIKGSTTGVRNHQWVEIDQVGVVGVISPDESEFILEKYVLEQNKID